jgi:hypothetical protein
LRRKRCELAPAEHIRKALRFLGVRRGSFIESTLRPDPVHCNIALLASASKFNARFEAVPIRRFEMDDGQIHSRIEELVAEEQELYERGGAGGLDESEHRRLESIKVGLDQCWDLLRQRRALREAGYDPSSARVRDPEVVERYEQ